MAMTGTLFERTLANADIESTFADAQIVVAMLEFEAALAGAEAAEGLMPQSAAADACRMPHRSELLAWFLLGRVSMKVMATTYGRFGEKTVSFIVLAVLLAGGAFIARPASGAEACGGDCNLNGLVAVNELVTGVNISLDPGKLAACKAMDTNNSLEVEVNELVAGVNHSLQGCPPIACVAPVDGRCVEITPGPGVQDKLQTVLVEAQPTSTAATTATLITLKVRMRPPAVINGYRPPERRFPRKSCAAGWTCDYMPWPARAR